MTSSEPAHLHIGKNSVAIIAILVSGFLLAAGPSLGFTPLPFDPPERTSWRPDGCRTPEALNPVLGSRTAFHNLHSDERASDEVNVALAPMFGVDWVAERNKWIRPGQSTTRPAISMCPLCSMRNTSS